MYKVLVTGASGFIGSSLVDKLLELGFDVTAAIRSKTSKKYLKNQKLKFTELDYDNVNSMRKIILENKYNIIFHLAGLTKAKNFQDFHKVNTLNTKNLVDAIIGLDVRLIYLSSFAAHGPGEETNFTQVRIGDKDEPNTGYGKSKLESEIYIKESFKSNYIILRPTGVYGPREKDYYLYFKTLKMHIEPYIGFSPQRLSFIYIDDLVDLCVLCINAQVKNKTYYVSDGRCYLDTEFAEMTKQCLKTWTIKLRFPLFIIRWISIINEFNGIIIGRSFTLNKDKYNIFKARNWNCDIQPLVIDLGFEPKINLKQGIRKTIDWYNKEGWL